MMLIERTIARASGRLLALAGEARNGAASLPSDSIAGLEALPRSLRAPCSALAKHVVCHLPGTRRKRLPSRRFVGEIRAPAQWPHKPRSKLCTACAEFALGSMQLLHPAARDTRATHARRKRDRNSWRQRCLDRARSHGHRKPKKYVGLKKALSGTPARRLLQLVGSLHPSSIPACGLPCSSVQVDSSCNLARLPRRSARRS
jgi:hypothetical protein